MISQERTKLNWHKHVQKRQSVFCILVDGHWATGAYNRLNIYSATVDVNIKCINDYY